MSVASVSVVLPCYNAHRHLGEALDSVRRQTVPPLEIIVINDGSTDPETIACLAALPADVRVVHQENRGLAGARNSGFRVAHGDWVLPLDCDDLLAPTMVERCLAAASASAASYAHAQIEVFGDESGVVRKRFNFFEQLATNQLPYCLLLKRAVWLDAGGYDETMRHGYEDWELNIRLGALGHFGAQVNEPLFRYRVSRSGMLKSVSQRRHAEIWTHIQRRHPALYSLAGLGRTWKQWRGRPSTHPLILVWCLVLLHRLLPDRAFNAIFFRLHGIGKSARA